MTGKANGQARECSVAEGTKVEIVGGGECLAGEVGWSFCSWTFGRDVGL